MINSISGQGRRSSFIDQIVDLYSYELFVKNLADRRAFRHSESRFEAPDPIFDESNEKS